MTDEELLALYSAVPTGAAPKPPDPKWLERSRHKQNAAAAQVEADELLREPTLGEKAASFAQGAAEAASFGVSPYAKGAAKALMPLALGGAAGLVVDDPIAGIPKRFREGVESQQEGRASMQEGKLGAAYGYGQGAVDLANAAAGVAAPARSALVAAEDVLAGAPVRQVVSSGLGPVKNLVAQALRKAGENADELRVLTTMGAHGGSISTPAVLKEVERVPGGVATVADVLRKTGISSGITTTGGIAKRAAALQETSGQAIGRMVDEAEAAGGYVDTRKLAAALRTEAEQVASGLRGKVSEVARQHAATLRTIADRIDAAGTNVITKEGLAKLGVNLPTEVKALSVGIGDDAAQAYASKAAGRPVAGKGQALMDTRRLTEGAIGETLAEAGLDPAAYQAAKRVNQVSRIAQEAAETSLGRAGKNNLIGLTTATLAQSNPALAVVHQVLKPLQSSARASFAETARDLARALEQPAVAEALGPEVVGELQAASAQGGPALKTAFDRIMKDNDVFKSFMMAGPRALTDILEGDDDDLDDVARMRALAR